MNLLGLAGQPALGKGLECLSVSEGREFIEGDSMLYEHCGNICCVYLLEDCVLVRSPSVALNENLLWLQVRP